jgi:hypothetical protein
MTTATFAARIRWRSCIAPAVELDTVHWGFPSAERAALFANGVGALALNALWLDNGVLELELTDGRRARFDPSDVAVWMRGDGLDELPDVAGFERVDRTPLALSAEGLDGRFEAKAFRIVTETTPERDVEVRLDVDLRRDILRVAVVGMKDPNDSSGHAELGTVFGIVPKA